MEPDSEKMWTLELGDPDFKITMLTELKTLEENVVSVPK